MLKTSNIESIEPKKSRVKVSSDSRARNNSMCGFDRNKTGDNKVDNKINDKIGKKGQKTSKSKNLFKSKKLSKSKKMIGSDFFTPKARLVFTKLKQAFVKAPIFHHFDQKHYLWIETNALGYAISRILSQLILDNLGQWHLMAFFSQKMILAKTRYKTHNIEL